MTASPQSMQFLRELVHRRSAIVLDTDKDYLIESRLGPLAKKLALSSIDELVTVMRRDENAPATLAVVEAMTTNETSFFRDIHPFEALKSEIIPKLMAARASERTLRIWCAAASTGQEPFSIAIALREAFPALSTWNVRILATDLNQTVLDRAKTGLYRQLEVNRGLPTTMLLKYFDRVGADWQVKADLRNMVQFTQLNLLERWPLTGEQDIVFMRNVLIYFDVTTKKSLLGRVRQALKADGTLILGGAESTMNLDDGYESVRIGTGVYYQHKGASQGKVGNAAR